MQYVDPWRLSSQIGGMERTLYAAIDELEYTFINARKSELRQTGAMLESAVERIHARIDGMERTLYMAMYELKEPDMRDFVDEDW